MANSSSNSGNDNNTPKTVAWITLAGMVIAALINFAGEIITNKSEESGVTINNNNNISIEDRTEQTGTIESRSETLPPNEANIKVTEPIATETTFLYTDGDSDRYPSESKMGIESVITQEENENGTIIETIPITNSFETDWDSSNMYDYTDEIKLVKSSPNIVEIRVPRNIVSPEKDQKKAWEIDLIANGSYSVAVWMTTINESIIRNRVMTYTGNYEGYYYKEIPFPSSAFFDSETEEFVITISIDDDSIWESIALLSFPYSEINLLTPTL